MSIRVQHIRGTTAEVESFTPLAGELGYDTTRKEAHLGDGATAGGMRLSKKNVVEIVSPAQITADQNDYNPATLKHAGALNINSDAARNITGMVPTTVTDTTDGRTLQIYNAGAFNITLKDQNALSAAANRFDLGGADVVLTPKTSVTLRYSLSATRWISVSSTVGSAPAAGTVLARTLANSALGFAMINGTIVASVGASALTVALKTLAGTDPSATDPVLIKFRNATLATGDYVVMSIAAATSLVISSGSSMGAINNIGFALQLCGFNDAGTFRLGLINSQGNQFLGLLTPDALVSSTAEGGAGAADSAGVIYTGVAVASKPLAVLGRLDWSTGLAAVGTWNAGPTAINLTPQPVLPSQIAASAMGAFVGLVNGTITQANGASALTVAVKTLAGNDPSIADPVYAIFRNASAGTGDYTALAITAATSLVISSGSTMGVPATNTAFRLWIVGFNDAGTFRLGAINCLSGSDIFPLGAWGIASSTAEGGAGAADSAQVFYTGVAVASKAYATLGYLGFENGLAGLGSWTSNATRNQLFGHGVPLPGTVVNRARSAVGNLATGTTIIPTDDTIPQVTEGDQYLTKAITPSSAANLCRVTAQLLISHSVAASYISAALFRDGAANAVAAVNSVGAGSFYTVLLRIDHEFIFNSVAATTLAVRGGAQAAGTTSFNGANAARYFNGIANSYLLLEEIMA